MEQPLYDEFGNYIGPSEAEDNLEAAELEAAREADRAAMQAEAGSASPSHGAPLSEAEQKADAEASKRAVVLFEDRKLYPDASEVYPGAETLVMDEDVQPLTQPILAPAKTKNFHLLEKKSGFPAVAYNKDFLISLMGFPELIRNIAVVGHLHHGKTSLLDLLVQHTHEQDPGLARSVRYTDSLQIEQERGVSIKSTPISLVLPTSKGKSYLINLLDTPGHVNFSDEVTAALRLADAALVVVDAVEGVMLQTERVLRHALSENIRVCVCVNKLDRLILELKLPPTEAYYKLRHTIDDVNKVLAAASAGRVKVSPEDGTVVFASTLLGYCFSLESFAQLYIRHYSSNSIRAEDFARQLWGDVWFHPQDRTLRRQPPPNQTRSAERSFVQFVLNPLYKLHAQVVGEDQPVLQPVLEKLGIFLKPEQFNLDSRPLLKLVMNRFFGAPVGLIDSIVKNCPSPASAAATKIERLYTGSMLAPEVVAMKQCSASGPLLIYVTKLYPKPDCESFEALGRVYSGTVRTGAAVRVLGEQYTPDDAEDQLSRDVTRLALPAARYRVDIQSASAGNWVLLEGVDPSITKSATIVSRDDSSQFHIFAPMPFNTVSVMKIAVEPLNPSELPKMVDGLRKVNKSYLLLTTKVEESGEHIVLGTGELYLDCVLHDLRRMYSEIEVKVSDPSVSFCETVLETSSLKCYAVTPNKENKLTMTAEPLERGLAEEIERGTLAALVSGVTPTTAHVTAAEAAQTRRAAQDLLQQKFEWDLLASRRVWAFGPDGRAGPNVLLNDCLPLQTDPKQLELIRASVMQGFQWATREGPLCEEPIRNVKFRLLDALVAGAPLQRGSGQVIPTARRVAYSAFLTAVPRLMEPVCAVEIQAPADAVAAIFNVLSRRRGHMTEDLPKPGSPLYTVRAFLPLIESFGFETDLRSHTQGQAFCLSVFDHWAVVPGDPLDRSIPLRPLEIAPASALAREFMVKTRRRKGLADDVSPTKFFDDELLQALQSSTADGGGI